MAGVPRPDGWVPGDDPGVDGPVGLRRSPDLRAAAFDLSPDPFALLEPVTDHAGVVRDFRYLEANTAVAADLRRSRDDLLGSLLGESLAREPAAALIGMCSQVLDGGHPVAADAVPLVMPDGATRSLDLRAFAVAGSVALTWRDVTARGASARALTAERARLAAVLSSDLWPYLFLEPVEDPDGDVVDFAIREANDAASHALGVPRDDLLTRRLLDLATDEVGPALLPTLLGVLDSGVPVALDDLAHVRVTTGDERRYDVRALPLQAGVVFAWRDVTERHRAAAALAESEARYRLLAEHAGDMVTAVDMRDTITYVSPSVSRLLGWTEEDLVGTPVWDLVHPDDLAAGAAARERGLRPGGDATRATGRMRRSDGTYLAMTVVAQVVIDDTGVPAGAVLTWRDVQAETDALNALAESEARYRLLAEHSGDVVMLTDERLQVTWASPSTRRTLGRPVEDLLGSGAMDLVHPDDVPSLRDAVDVATVAGTDARFRFRWRHVDGEYLWMEASSTYVTDDTRAQGRRVVQVREVDAQVRAEAALNRRASTDPLTGLVNRGEAMRRMAAMLAHRPRAGLRTAVLFCDLDGLKAANDRCGHAIGDLLITTAARRIAATVRDDDLVARIGGDEFLVVMPGVRGLDDAVAVAETIRRAVAQPIGSGDPPPLVASTVSIGLTLSQPADDVDSVIARADAAMYVAKGSGGDAIRVSPDDGS